MATPKTDWAEFEAECLRRFEAMPKSAWADEMLALIKARHEVIYGQRKN